jgi:hypothetical protein
MVAPRVKMRRVFDLALHLIYTLLTFAIQMVTRYAPYTEWQSNHR